MSRIKCSICSYPETLVFQAKIAIWKFELKLIDFLVYHFYDVLIFFATPKTWRTNLNYDRCVTKRFQPSEGFSLDSLVSVVQSCLEPLLAVATGLQKIKKSQRSWGFQPQICINWVGKWMIEGVFLQTRKFCPKHTMQIGNGVDMKTKSAQGCRHHHRRSQSRLPLIIHVLMNPPKKTIFSIKFSVVVHAYMNLISNQLQALLVLHLSSSGSSLKSARSSNKKLGKILNFENIYVFRS
jgi:hypothetical protein